MVRDRVSMKGASCKRVTLLRLLVVTPALILFLYFAFLLPLPSFELRARGLPQRDPAIPLVSNATGANASPLQALVDALRSATSAAARFRSVSFNAKCPGCGCEEKAWRTFNPCSARTELGPRYAQRPNSKLLDPNPHWDLVLEEYTALHGTCMRSIGNITDYYLSGATTSTCKFLIMEMGGVGLGNKVALLTSAMLYAVLTQRVILVNSESLIPWTMCEPFVGSCWILDQHFPLPGLHGWESTMLGRLVGWESHVWKSSAYFSRGIDAIKAGGDAPRTSAVKVEFSDPEMTRFYCNTEQAFLTEATWLLFTGCLYFLPKLFAVPAFRPALEALFPDPSLTLTYLLRSLMLPRNAVWEQVKQHDKDLFADADRRVGIQVRFLFGRKVYFEGASQRANDHVKQCVAENNILPKIAREPGDLEINPQSGNLTRVLVTSLHTALSEELQRTYENERTVKVTQLTHRQKQGFSTTEDHLAMVEILLLSFVDELIVTPLSTFGGLAQAYGATIPWFVEVKKEGSCVRAQTVDLCYQASHFQYDCPHESTIDKKKIPEIVPHLRRCLPIEESDGLQLVSPAFVRSVKTD